MLNIKYIKILICNTIFLITLTGCITTNKVNDNSLQHSHNKLSNFNKINKVYNPKNKDKLKEEVQIVITPADEVINFSILAIDYVESNKNKPTHKLKANKITPPLLAGNKAINSKVGQSIKSNNKTSPSPAKIANNKDVKTNSKKEIANFNNLTDEQFAKQFFAESRDQIEIMRVNFSKGTHNTIRAGLFDISSPGQRKNYDDSNYHAKESFLTTTYRPKTLYGADFYNYISYCPIFFNWEEKENIKQYFNKLNEISIGEKLSFNEITQYLIGITFSHCISFNEGYYERTKILNERKMIEVADMFMITLFILEGKVDSARFIVENNQILHKDNYVPNIDKLSSYLAFAQNHLNRYNLNGNDYFKVWNFVLKNALNADFSQSQS